MLGLNSKRSRSRSDRQNRKLIAEPLESRRLLSADGFGLSHLSDDFEDPSTVSQWQRIHEVEGWNADPLETYDIGLTNPGRLTMIPHTTSWFEDYRGPLVFKEVGGDFDVTTLAHVTDRDDVGDSDPDDEPDDSQFSLGGVMLRAPRAITNPALDWMPGSGDPAGPVSGENFVFLSIGSSYGNGMQLEVKNTRNSHSDLDLIPFDTQVAELRLSRRGNIITANFRLPGGEWQLAGEFDRPDLPDTLQVGLVSYTDYGKVADFAPFYHNSHVLSEDTVPAAENPTPAEPFNPDIEASFEYIRFQRPAAVVDGSLWLEGNDLDSEVLVEDLGGGHVSVSVSAVDPADSWSGAFNGVQRLRVNLTGGDDSFQYTAVGVADPLRAIDLTLGDGNDVGELFFTNAPGHEAGTIDLELGVSGDAGSDTVRLAVDRGGAGLRMESQIEAEQVEISLRDLAVAEADSIAVRCDGCQQLDRTLAGLDLRGTYQETLRGTEQSDTMRLLGQAVDVGPAGRFESEVALLGGDDRLMDDIYDGSVAGALSFDYSLGAGSDRYEGWRRDVQIQGAMTSTVSGDAGQDLLFTYLSDFSVASLASAAVQLDGGAGDDTIYMPTRRVNVDGVFELIGEGGEGDDFVWVPN